MARNSVITIGIRGEETVQDVLNKVLALNDMGGDVSGGNFQQNMLDRATAVILARIRARFLRQEAPDGSKWPLSHAAFVRGRRGKGGGTLFNTGNLFHSIQVAGVTDKNERVIATDVPYGPLHQYGVGQEVRVFLGFNDQDNDLVVSIIRKAVLEALK